MIFVDVLELVNIHSGNKIGTVTQSHGKNKERQFSGSPEPGFQLFPGESLPFDRPRAEWVLSFMGILRRQGNCLPGLANDPSGAFPKGLVVESKELVNGHSREGKN